MLLTPAQIKPKLFELRRNSFFFFTRGGYASCLRACLGARFLPQSYQYPNLSEGADRVGVQLRGNKKCPFSGVTKFVSVWRKVPESDARSVAKYPPTLSTGRILQVSGRPDYQILQTSYTGSIHLLHRQVTVWPSRKALGW